LPLPAGSPAASCYLTENSAKRRSGTAYPSLRGMTAETITRALRAYHDAADRETSGQADERLHRTIANATHNPVLVSLSMQLRSLLTLNLGMDPYTRKIREQATHQHTELVEAIEAGDADLAAAVAREHAQLSQKRIRNLVRRVRREQAESSDTA
jgi:GntR family transcriptional regulator, transcriptional repressor for pyruvate dehydrogenase complex